MGLGKCQMSITLKLSTGEEVENPATSVPKSMILAVIINGVLAFGWITAFLFPIDDVDAALESPTGQPADRLRTILTRSVWTVHQHLRHCLRSDHPHLSPGFSRATSDENQHKLLEPGFWVCSIV